MKFLTTKQISGEIERIIREANNFIIIISPYVKVSQLYIDRLIGAERNNVKVHFVFGKEHIAEIEESKFMEIAKMTMYFLDNLHAKCYLNEDNAIVTSMNLYDFSERNNREMGILVERDSDEKIYSDISREANSIIQNAKKYDIRYYLKESYKRISGNQEQIGYCIRCGQRIELNPEKPLCYECYNTWAEFFNYDYLERYCHICGHEAETSMAKPLCYSCFRYKN